MIAILLQTCSSIPLFPSFFSTAKGKAEYFTHTPSLNQQQNTLPVAEIARQVTVRILTKLGSGSGVLIARQGQTYTVLTSEHVAADSKNDYYNILSADGVTHAARRKFIGHLKGVDLALVQFESKKFYQVATLGDSKALSPGEKVYASGFPNYHFINQDAIEATRDWGTRAFRLTTGEVSLLLERSLSEGYGLGYTNEIEQGMSGGPVLNESGQVVGINGRLKYPLQGIDGFTFADGTKPSIKLFKQMEALSWAIPISTFRQLAEVSLTELNSNS